MYEKDPCSSDLDWILERPKRWKMDKRFGIWYVRGLYKAESLSTVAWELAMYITHLLGIQEFRFDNGER